VADRDDRVGGRTCRVAALRADFLDRAFGPAREPMDRFYWLIEGSHRPLLSEDLIGRMYRLLEEARQVVSSRRSRSRETSDVDAKHVRPATPNSYEAGYEAIATRLDALILYTHYVERWFD